MAVAVRFPVTDWGICQLAELIGSHICIDTGEEVIADAGVLTGWEMDTTTDSLVAQVNINCDQVWELFSSQQEWTLIGPTYG